MVCLQGSATTENISVSFLFNDWSFAYWLSMHSITIHLESHMSMYYEGFKQNNFIWFYSAHVLLSASLR